MLIDDRWGPCGFSTSEWWLQRCLSHSAATGSPGVAMPPPRVVCDHRNSVGEVEAAAALDHGDAQELIVPDSSLSGAGETSAF